MKSCICCGEVKGVEDFYHHPRMADGRLNKCKECCKRQERERRATNPAVQAYDRERAKTPERRAHAQRVVSRWRKENPEAYRAEAAVAYAVRTGKLVRRVCEVDGCERADVHAHHEDYTKPLEVRWLCPLHHHRHHAEEAA